VALTQMSKVVGGLLGALILLGGCASGNVAIKAAGADGFGAIPNSAEAVLANDVAADVVADAGVVDNAELPATEVTAPSIVLTDTEQAFIDAMRAGGLNPAEVANPAEVRRQIARRVAASDPNWLSDEATIEAAALFCAGSVPQVIEWLDADNRIGTAAWRGEAESLIGWAQSELWCDASLLNQSHVDVAQLDFDALRAQVSADVLLADGGLLSDGEVVKTAVLISAGDIPVIREYLGEGKRIGISVFRTEARDLVNWAQTQPWCTPAAPIA